VSLFQALLFDHSCVFKAQCTVLDRITASLGHGICSKVDSSRHSPSLDNICVYNVYACKCIVNIYIYIFIFSYTDRDGQSIASYS